MTKLEHLLNNSTKPYKTQESTQQFVGVFKGEQKINNYFKLKDKTSRHSQSNIACSVKCLGCVAEYVGERTQ